MQIVSALISHSRLRPRRNAFRYRLRYCVVPVSTWEQRPRDIFGIFSRLNFLSLRFQDYGDGKTPSWQWVREIIEAQGVTGADGEILLMTLPRLFGFAFNPVSFWFCLDRNGKLRAVVAEVNNTFGERHCYLCRHDDGRPIAHDEELSVRKVFHVSPFMEVKGHYRFRFLFGEDRVAIRIDLWDENGLVLATSMGGTLRRATMPELAKTIFLHPLQCLKVVALIHIQAAWLWLKGVRTTRKPDAPREFVTS